MNPLIPFGIVTLVGGIILDLTGKNSPRKTGGESSQSTQSTGEPDDRPTDRNTANLRSGERADYNGGDSVSRKPTEGQLNNGQSAHGDDSGGERGGSGAPNARAASAQSDSGVTDDDE